MLNITVNGINNPPPPPPPLPQDSSPKDSRKKLIVVVLLLVIIIVSAVVLVVLFMKAGPSATPTPGITATPVPGITASPGSGTPSPSQTNPIGGANSIQFSTSYTTGTQTVYAYTYSAKNLGTPNMMMRIDGTFSGESSNMIYIINGVQQKSWVFSDGEWTDMSQMFQSQYESWNSTWQGYAADLAEWAGTGEYTYTYPGTTETLRIYNISVNPQLSDSLFTR